MLKPCFVIHGEDEIRRIRKAAQAAAMVREELTRLARPGMTTKNLDDLAGSIIATTGGTSAFLGYRGFPGQICISLNEEVVHGIGSPQRVMKEGDLLSLDIGVKLDGGVGDTAKSFCLGETTPEVSMLLETTELALMEGIKEAITGNYVGDISAAVEKVAKKAGLGIVREYVGHGCGTQLHEPPEVPNFVTRNRGPRLVPGMVLAIEPMLNLGTHKVVTASDNWTVSTLDGKLSAHFEHMVYITQKEPEILTWLKM